jgi:hypothetical protein
VEHIVPVTNNTVVQRVGDLQHVPQAGGFVSNHDVLDLNISNLLLETEDGAPDHARENGLGKVAVGETAFHETGSVITDWKKEGQNNAPSKGRREERNKPTTLLLFILLPPCSGV